MSFLQFLPGFVENADLTTALKHISIARMEAEQRQYENAVVHFNSASAIFLSLGNKPLYLENQIELARIFLQIGKNNNAVQVLNSALETIQNLNADTSWQVGSIYSLLGFSYYALEDFVKAEIFAEKGVKQVQSVLGYYNEKTASSYYSLGGIKKAQGDYSSALTALNHAKNIQTKLLTNDKKPFANTLFVIGSVFDDLNDFDRALEYYEQSLDIYDDIGISATSNAANLHLYIMTCYINKGDYRKGIDHGKKTIEMYTSLSLAEHNNVAGAYGKLGEIYIAVGDFEKAKEYLLRSLAISTSRYPEKKKPQGEIHLRLASIYAKTGEFRQAVEYAESGIAIYEKANGEYHPQTGFMQEQAANVYREAGQFDNALKYFTKAIISRENVNDTVSRNDIAALYSSIGEIYLQKNLYDSAMINLQRSLTIEQKANEKNIPQNALLQHRFGDLSFSQQKFHQALQYYQRSIDILTSSESQSDLYKAPMVENSYYKKELLFSVEQKARTFEKISMKSGKTADLRAALVHYQTACAIVDDARKQFSSEGSKIFLAEKSASIYRQTCRIAVALFEKTKDPIYKVQAFLIADRSKGNILLEKLFDGEAKSFAGIPDSLLNYESDLLRSITSVQTQLFRTTEKNDAGGPSLVSELQAKHFALSQQHHHLVELLERQYPKYYELKYARFEPSLEQIQKAIQPKSLMVEYMIADSVIYVFTLTNRSLTVKTIRNTSATSALAQQFSNALKTFNTETYCSAGYELYSKLLRPLEKELAASSTITIIPDGYLFTVPFEALPTRQYSPAHMDFTTLKYVISSYDVTYSYSAAFDLKMNERMNGKNSAELNFAGFAPVFRDSIRNGDFFANRSFVKESGIGDVRSITLDGKKFNELKYSEDEVNSIEQTFTSHSLHSRNFLHTDATEKNFKEFCRDADIVHVATHGFINEKNPKLSAILFSQPKETTADDDGILYVDETFTLDLKAKLVVLSSCESGVGKLVDGEGMIALSRGLFYAGAQNIIYSLWKVSDKQTYLLMDEFYKNVVAGRSYASSLRSAKLSLIASKESAFPSKWSGFVLVGK